MMAIVYASCEQVPYYIEEGVPVPAEKSVYHEYLQVRACMCTCVCMSPGVYMCVHVCVWFW